MSIRRRTKVDVKACASLCISSLETGFFSERLESHEVVSRNSLAAMAEPTEVFTNFLRACNTIKSDRSVRKQVLFPEQVNLLQLFLCNFSQTVVSLISLDLLIYFLSLIFFLLLLPFCLLFSFFCFASIGETFHHLLLYSNETLLYSSGWRGCHRVR